MIPAVLLFYDGPSPAAGIFEDLVAIPAIVDLVQTYRFPEFVASFPGNDLTPGQRLLVHRRSYYMHGSLIMLFRAVFQTTPIVDYSFPVIEANINETLVRRSFSMAY